MWCSGELHCTQKPHWSQHDAPGCDTEATAAGSLTAPRLHLSPLRIGALNSQIPLNNNVWLIQKISSLFHLCSLPSFKMSNEWHHSRHNPAGQKLTKLQDVLRNDVKLRKFLMGIPTWNLYIKSSATWQGFQILFLNTTTQKSASNICKSDLFKPDQNTNHFDKECSKFGDFLCAR